MKKTIAVRLEGVLFPTPQTVFSLQNAQPNPQAGMFCKKLIEAGHKILIVTDLLYGRLGTALALPSIKKIEDTLVAAGIPFSEVYTGSGMPPYDLLVDSKATLFDGGDFDLCLSYIDVLLGNDSNEPQPVAQTAG